eukprot:gene8781-biopygen6144
MGHGARAGGSAAAGVLQRVRRHVLEAPDDDEAEGPSGAELNYNACGDRRACCTAAGLLGRRYIFPPPRNMDMGPLSDGQRECMERCRVYLGECRDRDPHSMEGDETDSDSGA